MDRRFKRRALQKTLGSSFRDPAGFVFRDSKGTLLRQINTSGLSDFNLLSETGLYDHLVQDHSLVKYKTLPLSRAFNKGTAAAIIQPDPIPFISYPFEWSFSQLKDAALLTLSIQKAALEHGMTLKDASAYNVQFYNGKPIFIDTLSFEKYEQGTPWQAYRQFCQHFLAPLALMSYTDINLSQLSRVHLDGIPLDLASKLLPKKAKIRPGIAMHIVLHGRAQKSKEGEHQPKAKKLSKNGLIGIIESLERSLHKMQPIKVPTEWADYYDNTNYTASAADKKGKLVSQLIKPLKAKSVLDLGGNNGKYSRLLNHDNIFTICTDIDPNAVEANYQYVKHNNESSMLPMVVDLVNPGGLLGWGNKERDSIAERLKCDIVMALALIHHLAISNNLSLDMIAEYFSGFGQYLLIEFVPKTDSQVKKLLSTREDIFPSYNEEEFKKVFSQYYTLINEKTIPGTKRTLFLYKVK
ncbi:MAG: SAM-dependent methyltransferase [Patescibacteria group bacterium]